MSIKKSQIEDKNIRPNRLNGQEESHKKRPKNTDGQIENKEERPNNSDTKQELEYNYPGKVTIKARSKKEADEKFKKLNNK